MEPWTMCSRPFRQSLCELGKSSMVFPKTPQASLPNRQCYVSFGGEDVVTWHVGDLPSVPKYKWPAAMGSYVWALSYSMWSAHGPSTFSLGLNSCLGCFLILAWSYVLYWQDHTTFPLQILLFIIISAALVSTPSYLQTRKDYASSLLLIHTFTICSVWNPYQSTIQITTFSWSDFFQYL